MIATQDKAAPARSINIDERIDANPIGPLQRRVVFLCFLLAVIDGFDAQAIAFVAPLLKAQLSIEPAQMGQLFSAALVGLMVGAFALSPLADRIGRKPVIIGACAVMGVFSLLTATAQTTGELFVYRFLTGVGLGGVMPNINTLTAEFAPARRKALMITIMFVGFPAGAVLGGLLSAKIITAFGWPSVFILGGVAPLLLTVALIVFLPESIRFLALKGRKPALIAACLARIDKQYRRGPDDKFFALEEKGAKGSFSGLFAGGRALGTVLIWALFFANLLVMYALFGWLPSVMREAGVSLETAIAATVAFNLGGVVGGLAIAREIDRRGPYGVLAAAYAIAAVAIALIGVLAESFAFALIAIFIAGCAVVGTQLGMNALVVSFYPTEVRTTGLGWALAVGRIGSIIGPVVVGVVIALEWSLPQVFFLTSAPEIICVGAILLLKTIETSRAPNRTP